MDSKSDRSRRKSRDAVQTTGWILWRGGLLLVGAYVVYEGVELTLDLLVQLGIPLPPTSGIALIVGGGVLVLLSVIIERFSDIRKEKQNSHDSTD